MSTVQEDDHRIPQVSLTNEDIQFLPRCSTPKMIPRKLWLPKKKLSIKNRDKSEEYCEWKKNLERKRSSRKFRLRGPKISQPWDPAGNNSIISGHLKQRLPDQTFHVTITRPVPIYHHIWYPVSYPTIWGGMANYYCYYQIPSWYESAEQFRQQDHRQFQPPQAFGTQYGETGGAAPYFNIFGNAEAAHNANIHYEIRHPIQQFNMNYGNIGEQIAMQHFYCQYQYPNAPVENQFIAYSSKIRRTANDVNVPLDGGNIFPVMMT